MVERKLQESKEPVRQKKMPTSAPTPAKQDDLMDLQRLIGNREMQRLLETSASDPRPATFIQTKLTVGAADDPYEREADSVAHQVMTMPDTTNQGESVQRQDEEDELMAKRDLDVIRRQDEEDELMAKRDLDVIRRQDEEDELMTKRLPEIAQRVGEDEELSASPDDMMDSFEVGGDVESQIQSSKGSGQPLPDSARDFLEPRFGQDFGDVRVHTGSEADSLNRAVSARAFTTGNDIFVRSSDYQPDSAAGRELLAHELTHVVQQTGGKPQAQPKRDEEQG